jgi:NRAMP (natural resistance-associated macrophage protein)-like metal ion transporter
MSLPVGIAQRFVLVRTQNSRPREHRVARNQPLRIQSDMAHREPEFRPANVQHSPTAMSRPAGARPRLRRFLKALGPGVIAGAANDDPVAIGTYSMAGATFGYALLWVPLFVLPLAITAVFLSSKVGLVGGLGVAGTLRRYYHPALLYATTIPLVIANVVAAGADLGAIASSIRLLAPIPNGVLLVAVALSTLALQIWGSYPLIKSIFKYLTLALFAYLVTAIISKPNAWQVVRHTLIPTVEMNPRFLMMLVAMIGAALSPYLYFWQASQHVEEKVARGQKRFLQRKGASEAQMQHTVWDVNAGMFFSTVVSYSILVGTAATLFRAGKHQIQSAADAAEALQPLAGGAAAGLFATGVVAVGFLAVPVLITGTAYALAEMAGWNYGLSEKVASAKPFYAAIACLTCVALGLNFIGINVFDLLLWSSTIQGFLTPLLLAVLIAITNNRSIVLDKTNTKPTNFVAFVTLVATVAAVVGLIWSWTR